MTTNYYITDKNDTFFYFEVIKKTNAKTVLDFYMFLSRIGAISRTVGDETIGSAVRLDAVSVPTWVNLPVYNSIYNNIYNTPADTDTLYDLTILLQCNIDINAILPLSKSVALKCENRKNLEALSKYGSVTPLCIEDAIYALIIF